MTPDVIVVGGGAAGLMAANIAAERGRQVLLLEKMDQCGRKLRITGKGRCNLTNTAPLRDTLPHIGPDPRFLRNAYGRFFNRELMDFFESRGVPLKEERGGRVFPASNRALDIFLALITPLEKAPNVVIRKGCIVKGIEVFREPQLPTPNSQPQSPNSELQTPNSQATAVLLEGSERIPCRHIILATGGLSYPTTGSTGAGLRIAAELGHTVRPCVPALVPLRTSEPIPQDLRGFALRNVTLSILANGHPLYQSPVGELQFTPDGLGGPLALSASRLASRPLHQGQALQAILDLKPALSPQQLDQRLLKDIDANGTRLFHDALRLWLPAELIPLALPALHIEYYKRLHQLTGDERRRLAHWLKAVPFTLVGTRDYPEAIITQGGVSTAEVNPKTMESRLVQGLHLVGELLDLDADTGGHNLQIAFSTAHAAGMAV